MTRRHAAATPQAGGFTLLEVLVALVVFGLLMVGMAQGTRFGLVAWDTQSRGIGRDADLDAVERVLRRLLSELDPGGTNDPPNIVGTSAGLAFTAELPEGAVAARPRYEAVARHADILLHVESGRGLVLTWTPHLHVRLLAPRPAPLDTALSPEITRLELAYQGADGGWRDGWRDRDPPRLIRVRLHFAAGDQRHWPDIIVAPLRRAANA